MLVVAGRITVKESSLPALLAAARKMVPLSLAETGCAQYGLAVDIDEPLVLHLFEQWDSEEALSAHFATAHFQEFSTVLLDSLDGPAELSRYETSAVSPLFG